MAKVAEAAIRVPVAPKRRHRNRMARAAEVAILMPVAIKKNKGKVVEPGISAVGT